MKFNLPIKLDNKTVFTTQRSFLLTSPQTVSIGYIMMSSIFDMRKKKLLLNNFFVFSYRSRIGEIDVGRRMKTKKNIKLISYRHATLNE